MMTMSASHDAALHYRAQAIETCRRTGNARLPSIARCAADAEVSVVTMWKAVQGVLWEEGQKAILRNAVSPLFDAALTNVTTDTWICANDLVALLAREYLVERGIGRIRLVGFDDSTLAAIFRITSYNFRIEEHISACIAHLLSPPRRFGGSANIRTFTAGGTMVERVR
jgi:DNA-binding LacI/PurR family transcriptional regulator